jgi:DNA repair protein RadA/Sms
MSDLLTSVRSVTKPRTFLRCSACGQEATRWVGRCPACQAWGTVREVAPAAPRGGAALASVPLVGLGAAPEADQRVCTGFTDLDRVLGGGLVPASVTLLAGEPGIGKSTLLLQLVANLSAAGHPCLLVSGEESHAQVASRARRLGIDAGSLSFAPGRELEQVLDTARACGPFLLAVDSIQSLRDSSVAQMPGGVSQVRACTDALVGLAKAEGIAVLLTGHVTKDGDLAGPRSLEHAVDVVLGFDGDHRSGLRVLSGGKNRFGAEGETAWFEMQADGLHPVDPTALLVSGRPVAGAATALARSGRRTLAVEVQALVRPSDGAPRRHVTGLDARRFQLVAAVLDRVLGPPFARAELFGASSGGLRVDDPSCDLAVAAALASAACGTPPPRGAAFVGEIALTGLVRSTPDLSQRLSAAGAAGYTSVFAAEDPRRGHRAGAAGGPKVVPVRSLGEALDWAVPAVHSDELRGWSAPADLGRMGQVSPPIGL